MTTKCRTQLLDDKPADSDFFGSHERVAEAIAEMVRDERGGRAIALEGTWGSGKSTVVKLLKSRLQDHNRNPDAGVFSFDAWAHRGDPLRRSFLEEIVKQFREWGWCGEDEWQSELNRLSQREEETLIKTTPMLTPWGGFILLALLLAPVGFQLIGLDETSTVLGISGGLLSSLGLLMALLPILVALIVYSVWRPWGEQRLRSSEFWLTHREPYDDRSILGLFFHRVQERQEEQRVQTPDPTSIEFHNIFRRIVGQALEESNRQLVVVVDNLDRVESDQALTIWSTMRTFFELRAYQATDWYNRFWLLVPFDKYSLRDLWAGEVADTEGSSTGGGPSAIEAFLDKSFQVRFHVAPPVPSDWQEFFEDRMAVAFPDHDDADERYTVFRIFSLTRDDGRATPREAVLFLNQLGAVHRQWYDDVPIELQALYVGKKESLDKNLDLLEQEDFVSDRLVRLIEEPEWQKHLAALHFNVPPERAMQVWMGSRVGEALLADEPSDLVEIADLPGVGAVCEETVEREIGEWIRNEPSSIPVAAYNLAAAEKGFGVDTQRRLWNQFEEAALSVDSWPDPSQATGLGLKEILKHTDGSKLPRLGSNISLALAASIPGTPGEDERWDPNGWIESTVPVLDELVARDYDPTEDFSVNANPRNYITVSRQLLRKDVEKTIWHLYKPEKAARDIVQEFVSLIQSGGLVGIDKKTVRLFRHVSPSVDLSPISEAVSNRLNIGTQGVDLEEIEHAADVLLSLYSLGVVTEEHVRPVVIEQSHLFSRLNQTIGSDKKNAAASLVILGLLFNPSGNINNHVGQGQNGLKRFQECKAQNEQRPDLVQDIWRQCLNFNLLASLMNNKEVRANASKLLFALIGRSLNQDVVTEIADVKDLPTLYPWLAKGIDPQEVHQIICTFAAEKNLVGHLGNIGHKSGYSSLYRDIRRCNNLTADQCTVLDELIESGLSKISDKDWSDHLTKETATLGLVFDQLDRQVDLVLTQQFREELENHATKVLRGSVEPKRYREKWPTLIKAIDPEMRGTFLRNLRDQVYWKSNQEAFVELYGDIYLVETKHLTEKSDDVVRGLLSQLLDSEKAEAIRWVTKCIKNAPDLLQECDQKSRSDFEQRVVRRAANVDAEGNRLEALEELVEVLGLQEELGQAREERETSDLKKKEEVENQGENNSKESQGNGEETG